MEIKIERRIRVKALLGFQKNLVVWKWLCIPYRYISLPEPVSEELSSMEMIIKLDKCAIISFLFQKNLVVWKSAYHHCFPPESQWFQKNLVVWKLPFP